jgi:ribosomal protein S18 acetylase RimI-like enzyme
MEIHIRPAIKEDCTAMMQLIHELALYEKAPQEVTVSFDHFVESGFGEKPVWWAFVATSPLPSPLRGESVAENEANNEKTKALLGNEDNIDMKDPMHGSEILHRPSPKGRGNEGEIIAFALYYIRYSTWKGQRMYLEDLLVTEEMRGKGIGSLLLDKLIEEAKEKKFSGIMWQVLGWNEPAINFYKKYKANFDGEWLNVSINF